jgi:c-di-GMP-related signal transduction protein
MQTVAYELLFRDGMNNAFPDVSPEYATSRMISDQFLCIPVPRIANNHSSFINVPHQMIINGLGDTLPNEKVVIEILENAVPDDALFCAVKDMHDRVSLRSMISRWMMNGTALCSIFLSSNLMSETMTMKISGNISTEKVSFCRA